MVAAARRSSSRCSYESTYGRSPSTHPTDSPAACVSLTTTSKPGCDRPARIRLSVSGVTPACRATAECVRPVRLTACRNLARHTLPLSKLQVPFPFKHRVRDNHERLRDGTTGECEGDIFDAIFDFVIAGFRFVLSRPLDDSRTCECFCRSLRSEHAVKELVREY